VRLAAAFLRHSQVEQILRQLGKHRLSFLWVISTTVALSVLTIKMAISDMSEHVLYKQSF